MHCYPPTASCVSNLSHKTSGYHIQHMVILHISVFTMVEGPEWLNELVGLPNNSYMPIINTASVRARRGIIMIE